STIWIRRIEQSKAKLASYNQQIRNVEAKLATKSADRAALEVRLGVAKDLETMRDYLFQKQLGSKVNYLDAKSQRLQVEREILVRDTGMTEREEDRGRYRAEKAAYRAESRQKPGEELVQPRRAHAAAAKQLEKGVGRNAVRVLTAPADAIVL